MENKSKIKSCAALSAIESTSLVDELMINANNYTTEELLTEFCEKLKATSDVKTVILNGGDAFPEASLVAAVRDKFEDLEFKVCSFLVQDKKAMAALKEVNIPYYYNAPLNTFEEVVYHISIGVSDVLIDNALGYNLVKVADICHKSNVKVRVFPCYGGPHHVGPDIAKFFIRPEDYPIAALYCDVYDFSAIIDKEFSNYLSVYLKAYFLDKSWFGPLSSLIIYYDSEEDNKHLDTLLFSAKINCNHKCIKGEYCKICTNVSAFAKTLKSRNIVVI